jgi:epoxyqueuosine reductase
MNAAERTQWIEIKAKDLGFDLCGVAPAAQFEELEHLPEWLARGYAGEMKYLRDARRANPALALEGARSMIVVALNYRTPEPYSTEVPPSGSSASPRGWISRYAWGDDYHQVVGAKLETLVQAMRAEFREPFDARAYVDTGPVVERVAAHHAGIGWLAKNTMLINERLGSWIFLGVILTTLDLAPSLGPHEPPPADLCGNCTLCIDACPTGAIVEPYVLDARRCISYLTIELRGAIPEEFRAPMGRMVFGCDICQDVCPWNRNAPVTRLAEFQPRALATNADDSPPPIALTSEPSSSLFAPPLETLASLSEDEFRAQFRGSPIKRTKWRGLVRNACVALGNAALAQDSLHRKNAIALLDRLAASDDAIIAEHARWALARLDARN